MINGTEITSAVDVELGQRRFAFVTDDSEEIVIIKRKVNVSLHDEKPEYSLPERADNNLARSRFLQLAAQLDLHPHAHFLP